MRILLLFGALLLAATSPSAAASFDCKKPNTPAETLICAEATISALDDEMARLYFAALKAASPAAAAAFRADQIAWLTKREACRRDAQCLLSEYRARIEQIRRRGAELGVSNGPFDPNQGPSPSAPTPKQSR